MRKDMLMLFILLFILNILIGELNIHSDNKPNRYAAAFSYFAAGVVFAYFIEMII